MSSKNTDQQLRTLEQQLANRALRLAEHERILNGILGSRSWRWTQPLRSMADRARKLLGREDRLPVPYPARPAVSLAPNRWDQGFGFKGGFAQAARMVLDEFLASGARLNVPTAERPLISVILVVFNRAELTLPCLRSLAEQTGVGFELIVVDNGSTDRTTALFDRVDGPRVYRNPENLYFIRAVNQGAAEARGTHLLLLNNDTVLLPGALQALAATMASSPDIGAVGGKIMFLDGWLQEAGSIVWNDGTCVGYGRGEDPLAPPYMFRRDVSYCSGALFLTRRDLFEQLQGFDEAYSPAYYEETDYCMRLWDAGYRVVFEPAAAILHYEFASRSTEEASRLQARHRKVFVQKNADRLKAYCLGANENILIARTAGPPRQRILMIDDRVPHPHLGAGFPRIHGVLTRLVEWDTRVTMYPTEIPDEDWSQVYSDVPREVEVMLGFGTAGLEAFLKERRGFYDTILVSRPTNMERLAKHLERHPEWFSNTRIVYDAEAIFSAREIRKQEVLGNPIEAERQRTMLHREMELARGAHTVISVSEKEARPFQEHGIECVHVLGHALDIEPTTEGFAQRSGFLFVGAVHDDTDPNGDAAIWLGEGIMPQIRQALSDATLTVVGVHGPSRLWALDSEGMRVLGPIKYLRPLYEENRVFVAPTRFSAGVPHKIHEAAAQGIPIVATSLLAEQLGWTDGVEILVGDTAGQIAQRCVELYTNPDLWERLRANALERVAHDCSASQFDQTLRNVIAAERAAPTLVAG